MPRRHPLSLHDERGERRAKGRRKPFGAVFRRQLVAIHPFGISPIFRPIAVRLRAFMRGVLRFRWRKGGSRAVGQLQFEPPTSRGLPNAINTVRFLAADALRASARRPDRGLASARQACGGLQRRYLGVVPAPPGNFLCSFFASPVLIFVSAVAFHHDKW